MIRTREEHLAWAKRRALEYLDAGDLQQAFTSMGSDLSKHPDLKTNASAVLDQLGLLHVLNGDREGLRRWIEGFQ